MSVINFSSIQEMSDSEEHKRYAALTISSLISVPYALRAAVKLGVFDIIAEGGPEAFLSSEDIASKIPNTSPTTPIALERILRMLLINDILNSSHAAGELRARYGLGKLGQYLVSGPPGTSVAPTHLLAGDKVMVDGLYYLEDAVLDPSCEPFVKANGKTLFEFMGENLRFREIFHQAMRGGSIMTAAVIFDKYKGFEDVKDIVDVGGSSGAVVAEIVSKYPHIRGRNFDLPYVIANAPQFPGVEHVSGNMFESIPTAETIFMKSILHDWDDEQCIEILKNCWKALPEGGKVIDVDLVVPTKIENDLESLRVLGLDMTMMACCPRGRERTIEEFRYLREAAGFAELKDYPVSNGLHVLEFHKSL